MLQVTHAGRAWDVTFKRLVDEKVRNGDYHCFWEASALSNGDRHRTWLYLSGQLTAFLVLKGWFSEERVAGVVQQRYMRDASTILERPPGVHVVLTLDDADEFAPGVSSMPS
jgi:hypothetical protein